MALKNNCDAKSNESSLLLGFEEKCFTISAAIGVMCGWDMSPPLFWKKLRNPCRRCIVWEPLTSQPFPVAHTRKLYICGRQTVATPESQPV